MPRRLSAGLLALDIICHLAEDGRRRAHQRHTTLRFKSRAYLLYFRAWQNTMYRPAAAIGAHELPLWQSGR